MQPEMTFDYGSETPAPLYTSPSFLLSCIGLRSGRVKLFNFRARLSDLSQRAEAIPQHRPKQHVVCLHHFDRPMKLHRQLDGRNLASLGLLNETPGRHFKLTERGAVLRTDAPGSLRYMAIW